MTAAVARLPRTFVRFALVGVANTALDVALFAMLCPALGILVANVVSTSFGMAFSFAMNGRHTFGATHATRAQAMRFLATNVVTMWLAQPLAISAAHAVPGVSLAVAKLAGLGLSMVANFLLYRYVVWSRPAGAPGAARERPPFRDGVADVRVSDPPRGGLVAAREATRR
ncbi:MAG TPA: GtrA family protein [Nocardioides sp.]|jgi:putative flippase GtrA|uniref:GtrA family protein n=1 Tax=Nocardioides sp. TaxID=35761 RepID=UPI002E33BD97|nr:GtrA family protein [Nocardioides sp.]HEX3931400.1 GtrA family protein [Nocardioides sp.]